MPLRVIVELGSRLRENDDMAIPSFIDSGAFLNFLFFHMRS